MFGFKFHEICSCFRKQLYISFQYLTQFEQNNGLKLKHDIWRTVAMIHECGFTIQIRALRGTLTAIWHVVKTSLTCLSCGISH